MSGSRRRGHALLWRRQSYNIPAARLGFIQALVCDFEQVVGRRAMLRERGYACRQCERSESLLLILQPKALYFGTQRVRTNSRVLRRGLRQDDGELLTAVAATYIGRTKEGAKQVGKGL